MTMVTKQVNGRHRTQILVDLISDPLLCQNSSSKHLFISLSSTSSPAPLILNLNADPEGLIHLHIN